MTGRRTAVAIALLLVATVIWVDASRGAREPAAVTAIRHEFGTGWLAGCFTAIAWRESKYSVRAANWTDRHSDGSRGSFGMLQLGALWRNNGETTAHFAARMFIPAQAARLAHSIYRRYGLQPWGGTCT